MENQIMPTIETKPNYKTIRQLLTAMIEDPRTSTQAKELAQTQIEVINNYLNQ
jgi:hypothetical protein